MEDLGYPFCGLSRNDAIRVVWIQGLDQFSKLPFGVDPATGDQQSLPFLFQGVVNLVTICNENAIVILQELFGMIRSARWLVIVQDYRMSVIALSIAIYPHVAVTAGSTAVMNDFKRRFIRMDYMGIEQLL